MNATLPLIRLYLDQGKEHIRDLKPEEIEQDVIKEVNNEGWITVDTKGKSGNKVNKSRNKSDRNTTTSSNQNALNISKKFQEFLVQSRNSKDHVYDPSSLFSAISYMFQNYLIII